MVWIQNSVKHQIISSKVCRSMFLTTCSRDTVCQCFTNLYQFIKLLFSCWVHLSTLSNFSVSTNTVINNQLQCLELIIDCTVSLSLSTMTNLHQMQADSTNSVINFWVQFNYSTCFAGNLIIQRYYRCRQIMLIIKPLKRFLNTIKFHRKVWKWNEPHNSQ